MSVKELQAIESSSVIPSYRRFPVEFVRGEGCRLWDDEGNEYLDFLAGISVCNVGHCHPAVVAAVQQQVERLIHVTNLFYTEPAMRLAQRLAASSLGGKVYFANSGAEANEAAIKLCRKARPGGEIVVIQDAFHGRTLGALSATPQPAKQDPFAPMVPGFVAVAKDPQAVDRAVHAGTSAVFIEPIQGEGGIYPMSAELLSAARAACDRTGAILVFDEVQSGMGRTGTLWAYQSTGVVPDLLTSAKGLGGGMPLGALITNPALGDVFAPGDHGSTFAGGPVIASAALAALEVIDDQSLLASVRDRGARLAKGLAKLPGASKPRGAGLMLAVDVDGDAPAIVERALLEERLVINATGPNTLRFLPPLIVSDGEVDEALKRLDRVMS